MAMERDRLMVREREKKRIMARGKERFNKREIAHAPPNVLQQRGKSELQHQGEREREIQQKGKNAHNLGMCCNKEKRQKDSIGGRDHAHPMMHYNKKERNKVSMQRRKKKKFNARERERSLAQGRESDDHK